ncbi:MAG TPA: prepilin-type N-terminal cleavage/methylation domain-containing protein [Candidatus Obscuribacterales bacterium]
MLYRPNRRRLAQTGRPSSRLSTNQGFTLLEIMVILLVMGLVSAIALPSWVAFQQNLVLAKSQDQAFLMMRQAQQEATRNRGRWQASFREVNGTVQAAVHPIRTLPAQAQWQPLSSQVAIDPTRTTLLRSQGVYRVQFNHKGNVNGQLGRLTLMRQDGSRMRRCVVVSTLLGVLRKNIERSSRDRSCSPARLLS